MLPPTHVLIPGPSFSRKKIASAANETPKANDASPAIVFATP